MATKEETPPPPPSDDAAPKKKSKKLLIIIIAGSVVLLSLIVVVVVLLLKPAPEAMSAADMAAAEAQKQEAAKAAIQPVFERLETFTVNLLPEKGEQYLQAEITLEIEGVGTVDKLKTLMPRVRNQINIILAGKKASEIMPKEGKTTLAAEIRADVNAIIGSPSPVPGQSSNGPVMAVLFTSFIIQ